MGSACSTASKSPDKQKTKENVESDKILELEDFTPEAYQFLDYCKNGDLNNAQMSLNSNSTVNTHLKRYRGFKNACVYGNLEIAKWLLFIDSTINIRGDNDYAFRNSCLNGHLTVAQWLWHTDPSIHIRQNNDYVFFYCFRYKHMAIVKWLSCICDEYKIKYHDNNENNNIEFCYIIKNDNKYCGYCCVTFRSYHCCQCIDKLNILQDNPNNNSSVQCYVKCPCNEKRKTL
jgi:hypothetical protein